MHHQAIILMFAVIGDGLCLGCFNGVDLGASCPCMHAAVSVCDLDMWVQWAEGRRAFGGCYDPAHRQHEVDHPHHQRRVSTPTPRWPLCCLLQRQSLYLRRDGKQ